MALLFIKVLQLLVTLPRKSVWPVKMIGRVFLLILLLTMLMTSVKVSTRSLAHYSFQIDLSIKFNVLCNLFIEIAGAHYEADEAIKQKKFADLKKEVLPFYLEKLEAAAKENNGYLALGQVHSINGYDI